MTKQDSKLAPTAGIPGSVAASGAKAASAMADKPKALNRRIFFTGLGMVAAAGTAVAVVTPAAGLLTPAADPAAADEPAGDGYRLTEHVKKYYRTTTI